MSYDETLAERIRRVLSKQRNVTEKKMFGGVAFLLDGHMSCGIVGEDLMVRVGPELYQRALRESGARPMDFTGRPMKGYVFVGAEGCKTQRALEKWVLRGTSFVSSLPTTGGSGGEPPIHGELRGHTHSGGPPERNVRA